jgi:hypothetical protein
LLEFAFCDAGEIGVNIRAKFTDVQVDRRDSKSLLRHRSLAWCEWRSRQRGALTDSASSTLLTQNLYLAVPATTKVSPASNKQVIGIYGAWAIISKLCIQLRQSEDGNYGGVLSYAEALWHSKECPECAYRDWVA